MTRLLAALAAVCVCAPAFAQQAPAGPQCGDPQKLRQFLFDKFGEQPTNVGVTEGGTAIMFTLNPTTHTWTFVALPNAGMACIVASGDQWTDVPEDAKTK